MNLLVDILQSAGLKNSPLLGIEEIWNWIAARKKEVFVKISEKPISQLKKWHYNYNMELVHDSGKFFAIRGINTRIFDDVNYDKQWIQPIIDQPEIGFLGIITKKIDGILYFLMQAKIEPGNLNYIQISPTLQATRSNFSKVHKGRTPRYLEYFTDLNKNIIADQLQSEQGSRFLYKRNRNIIILIDQDIKIESDFCWMTLGQIKELMTHDNVVNMDTRTVLSLLPLSSSADKKVKNDMKDFHSWMSDKKMLLSRATSVTTLSLISTYNLDKNSIYDKKREFFSVIGCTIEVSSREVAQWDQPLIQSAREGLFCFFIKKIYDTYHFLVQAVIEPGLMDIVEIGPTVQISSDQNCNTTYSEYIREGKYKILHDSRQSEEGGRFYREENRNLIIEVNAEFDENVPDDYFWLTLNQLNHLVQFSNILNIQARSLLSLIDFDGEK